MHLKKPSFERESPCMAEIKTRKYTHPEKNTIFAKKLPVDDAIGTQLQ